MSARTAGAGIAAGLAGFVGLLAMGREPLAWSVFLATFTLFCFTTRLSLNVQIGLAVLLGAGAGAIPGSGVESVFLAGRTFIALLKMLIAPMILLAISHGIASMAEAGALGRLGLRTLGLYVLTMALAVATGLLFVNLFEPGAASALRDSEFFQSAVSRDVPVALDLSLRSFLETTILQTITNPIAALAEGRILPIVFFAVLFGLALLQLGETARPLVELLDAAFQAVMRIIGWFIRLAPIGVFALLGQLVATVGFAELARNLGEFALVVIGATLVHAFVTLPLVARVLAGLSPLELFAGIREALLVAFSTSSSAATLPVTTRCVEENLGVPRQVSSFVLPLGATVNMDGTALYEAIAAIFVANVYGIELGLASQLVVFAMAMLMAMGAPGIPSAGMVTMIVVLEAVGLPGEAVGLLITIDRLLDTFRTMANVEGDAVVAVCVARATSLLRAPAEARSS